jgi:hypothetical protein
VIVVTGFFLPELAQTAIGFPFETAFALQHKVDNRRQQDGAEDDPGFLLQVLDRCGQASRQFVREGRHDDARVVQRKGSSSAIPGAAVDFSMLMGGRMAVDPFAPANVLAD